MVSLADDCLRSSGPNAKSWIAAACLTGGFAVFGAINALNTLRSANADECAKKDRPHFATNIRRASRLHNECAVTRACAPEISPMIDKVIERLNVPNHRLFLF
jgi:hypothetical protein